MNYITSSPETATSESCSGSNNSSASSSVTNQNYELNKNTVLESLHNIEQQDELVDDIQNAFNNLNLKKAPIDVNFINDHRVLQNLLTLEDSYCIQTNYFMHVQQEIKPWMRNVLSNWMLEVCENQKYDEDVFVLAMNILDRFLCIQPIGKGHLQLLGTACMFIASKVKCSVALNAETLVIYTDRSISIEDLLDWEQFILQKLHWDVCAITPNDFTAQLLARLANVLDNYTLKAIRQQLPSIISLCSTDFRFSILTPSMIASGCILNVVNFLIDDEKIYKQVIQILNESSLIEIDCLKECKEQIEELIETSFQMKPELAEKLNLNLSNRQKVLRECSVVVHVVEEVHLEATC